MFSIVVRNLILWTTLRSVFGETTPPQSDNCYLPTTPPLEDLVFKIHPQNHTINLGTNVEEYTTVHIECKNGRTLRGQPNLLCINGEWSHDFPTCDNACDGTLLNRLSLHAICDYRDKFTRCPEKIAPGTFVQLKCAYGYKREAQTPQSLRCLSNGSFDKIPEPCQQDCAVTAASSTSLSKGHTDHNASVAPWHVGIYAKNSQQYDYICGGSIISPTVILSAAHCFWSELSHQLDNSTNFHVIAGRSSRLYSAAQTNHSQIVKVQEIHVTEEYQGKAGHQRDDIALLILTEPLQYSENIAPICFPKDLRNSASNYVQSDKDGIISIFGKTDQLAKIQVKTVAYHDCASEGKLADDKFCAYTTDDNAVWFGNSGAAFLTINRDPDASTAYYKFWGVLSHLMYSRHEHTRTGDQAKIAITNIFGTPLEFKRKVLSAMKRDESLI